MFYLLQSKLADHQFKHRKVCLTAFFLQQENNGRNLASFEALLFFGDVITFLVVVYFCKVCIYIYITAWSTEKAF